MDGPILDQLLAETLPEFKGATLGRPRLVASHALVLELSHNRFLWFDVGRRTAGFYFLGAEDMKFLQNLATTPIEGKAKPLALLARKHLRGRRVSGCRRVGTRTLFLEAGDASLVLDMSGPGLALVVRGEVLAGLGRTPEPFSEAEGVAGRTSSGLTKGGTDSRPFLSLPSPLEACRDSDLAPPSAVGLLITETGQSTGKTLVELPSFREATRLFLQLRARGDAFAERHKFHLASARRDVKRFQRLHTHLLEDREALKDPRVLRLHAEALLASPTMAARSPHVEVKNPYAPNEILRIPIDSRLSLPKNAEVLFEKARRLERAEKTIGSRLAETVEALGRAEDRVRLLESASSLSDLEPTRVREAPERRRGPLRYLTSRGLLFLVGRGAAENQELTFSRAGPEDFWLHAQGTAGAHVILDRHAGPDDLREAAEAAAYFSDARGDSRVDVHVARRKHIRRARGGAGRVRIFHSETLRVQPRDPEGRLRRR